MRKILSFLIISLFVSGYLTAQEVPQGMKYQAVARDLKGQVLTNKPVSLRISLASMKNGSMVTHYTEFHDAVSNEVGLFNLIVGDGKTENKISNVPWGSENIWMEVAIMDQSTGAYTIISQSKLMSVPYAFHAGTASKLLNGSGINAKGPGGGSDSPSPTSGNSWNTNGNLSTNPANDYMGTADNTDLIFKTNGAERLRITAAGKLITPTGVGLELGGNLQVNGDSTIIDKDLYVGNNVILNYKPGTPSSPSPGVIGSTINRGNFTVSDMSSTNLTGSLTVDKLVRFNDGTQSTDATTGALVVTGGTGIGKNLNVGGITTLLNTTESNTKDDGALVVEGGVGIEKKLNVEGITTLLNTTESTSKDDGALVVEGGVGIEKKLNIGGIAKVWDATTSTNATTGALIINGGTGIGGTLNVGGITKLLNDAQSNNKDDGSLVVEGGVGIEKNLNVGGDFNVLGTSSFKAIDGESLSITKNSQGYLATFTNTNAESGNNAGDGIKIKLGKEQPLDLGSFSLPGTGDIFPGISGALKNSFFTAQGGFNTSLTAAQFGENVFNGVKNDVLGYTSIVAGGAIDLTNKFIDLLNDKVLPIEFPDLPIWGETVLFPGYDDPLDIIDIPRLAIPALTIPKVTLIPEIPLINNPFPANPFNWTYTAPSISSAPLNKSNEFIGFFDKDDNKVGAIRGQSLPDVIEGLFDVPHLVSYVSTFVNAFDIDFGIPDPTDVLKVGVSAFSFFINTWDAVGNIGVEYNSGSGDYAEWLERMDPKEMIGTGDIVAVKGGKITKDLKGAEQIMAVSQYPIVLGNMPSDANKIHEGNNIAFMGQIPVKVMGPVQAGDYIVAKSEVSGYGIAVNPANMRVEDYKLAVGRSWETMNSKGPKMVNTVVGVHNNGFLEIIKELQEKADTNDARLKVIEEKLNISTNEKTKEKKAFK